MLPVPEIPLPSGGYGPRLWLITKDNNWDSLIPWFKYCARIPRGTIIKIIPFQFIGGLESHLIGDIWLFEQNFGR